MTLGVLCYALPVSIFSDLWQRELKQLNAFTSVTGASSSTEGHSVYNSDESSRTDTTPPKIISTLTPLVEKHLKKNSDDSSQPSIRTNEENNLSESGSIRVSRDDLLAIRSYMETIEDAQTKLNEILNRIES